MASLGGSKAPPLLGYSWSVVIRTARRCRRGSDVTHLEPARPARLIAGRPAFGDSAGATPVRNPLSCRGIEPCRAPAAPAQSPPQPHHPRDRHTQHSSRQPRGRSPSTASTTTPPATTTATQPRMRSLSRSKGRSWASPNRSWCSDRRRSTPGPASAEDGYRPAAPSRRGDAAQ